MLLWRPTVPGLADSLALIVDNGTTYASQSGVTANWYEAELSAYIGSRLGN